MDTPNSSADPGCRGWVVLAALMYVFLAAYAFPYFGGSVLNVAMAESLKLPHSALGQGFALMTLAAGLPAPLVALFMQRCGARGSIMLGSGLIALGSALMATVVAATWSFVLVFGLLIGVGIAFAAAVPAQTTVTQWFTHRRALAMSLLWLMVGVGGAIAAPILGRVVHVTGRWNNGWWLIGLLALAAFLAAAFVVKQPPAHGGGGAPVGAHAEHHAPVHGVHLATGWWTARRAMRSTGYWNIAAGQVVTFMAITCMFAYLVAHFRDLGHSAAFAASALGMVALGQIIGKLTAGMLGHKVEPRFLWAGGMIPMAVGFVLAVHATTPARATISAICMGIGNGAALVAAPTMLGNYFGAGIFASLYSTQVLISTLFAAAGPLIVAMAYQASGSYGMSFFAVAALLLAGAMLVARTRPPPPDAPDEADALL
ncbi:MFS transporter [Frateuria aurantia]